MFAAKIHYLIINSVLGLVFRTISFFLAFYM